MEHPSVLPHLIHIGFPKCASTFLQEWFAAHPQVAYKPGGFGGLYGVHDLVAEVLSQPTAPRCRVSSAEELSVPGSLSSSGDLDIASRDVRNRWMGRICDELGTLFPNAMILMITRNQADLAMSGYSQIIRQGGAIVAEDYTRLLVQAVCQQQSLDYDRALTLYRERFEGRVLALPYELLVDDRAAFLATIADFIGVDRFDIGVNRINESLDGDQLYWYPRIARLLRRAPSRWLRAKLIRLHVRFIRLGAWRPLINLLKRMTGPKSPPFTAAQASLRALKSDYPELLKSELYAPYRDVYRGSAAPPTAP